VEPLAPTQPANPSGDGSGIDGIVGRFAEQLGASLKPAVAAAIATNFGFPLILMIAVLLFILIQSRLDDRDPKLRVAPLPAAEMVVPFLDEDHL
jgi:hypothetical protein